MNIVLDPTDCFACHSDSGPGSSFAPGGDQSANNVYPEIFNLSDTANPANSLILLKPTAQVGHGGGERFTVGSVEYNTLLDWITAGALNN
jgi:hypothetical protein